MVRVGNALVPKSRLAEFVGKRAAKALVDPVTPKIGQRPETTFKPLEREPSLAEVMYALKALDRKIESVRKAVVSPASNQDAIQRSLRLAVSAQQQHQLQLMEQAFITAYGNPRITSAVLRSASRKKSSVNARCYLFKLILDRLPGMTYPTLGLYFMRHSTSVHYAVEKIEKVMKGNPAERQFYASLDRRWRSELERLGGDG